MFQDEGGRAGYTFYVGDGAEERNAHGMMIALRNTCIDPCSHQRTVLLHVHLESFRGGVHQWTLRQK